VDEADGAGAAAEDLGDSVVEVAGSVALEAAEDLEAAAVARAGKGDRMTEKRNRRDHACVKMDWEYDETR
jgi:hypothetical protein